MTTNRVMLHVVERYLGHIFMAFFPLVPHFNAFHPNNFGYPQKMIDTFRFANGFPRTFLAKITGNGAK